MKRLFLLLAVIIIASCGSKNQLPELKYESYTLDNGLKVVLHQDHSDPIVAVAIQYHVGSGREKPGKTGFAHFFEHMLFQRSENLPRNAFFQKIAAMGGTFNGSTNGDGTNYFETVPRDALEKVLWMESDRMGFFINTVTQGGLEREIDVVSNEKRQNYDTQPYGQGSVIIAQELYPKGHPYSWTTIGEIDDLRGATVEDVKEFYKEFYVPSNATLVIAGDFDRDQTKELVEKYFGEIAKGNPVAKPQPKPVKLATSKKMMWEDDLARLPQLILCYPTVEQYHKDANAISLFTSLFSSGKKSPLYRVIVEDKKLAPNASAYNMTREVAGHTQIMVRAFNNIALNDVYDAIQEAFVLFEKEGVDEVELERLKTMYEVNMYNRMGSVMSKALMMARDNEFGGSPIASVKEIEKYQAVTAEQIMDVYRRYFKDKPYMALSMFPKGQSQLALPESVMAVVSTEKVDEITSKSQAGVIIDDPYEKSPSLFDRSVEPDYMANTPEITIPTIWNYTADNGMNIYGITQDELPVIQAYVILDGGSLLDPEGKKGLSYLNASLMNEGTAKRTVEELETAIGLLGARIYFGSSNDNMSVYISSLAKNFDKVMEIFEEMLLEPRFDEAALERIKKQTSSRIRQDLSNPNTIAFSTLNTLLYGKNSTYATPTYGTNESLDAITIEDIKEFYNKNLSPSIASLIVVGDIDVERTKTIFASLNSKWEKKSVEIPAPVMSTPVKGGDIYFVDNPGATQSMILIGKRSIPFSSPDYYPSVIANNKLGSGSQGLLFEVLRLQRGYTYGAYSSFTTGTDSKFIASSSVQGSKTKESVELFKEILTNYPKNYDADLLELTRSSMMRSMASSFETLGSLANMLVNIAVEDMPFDYVKKQEDVLKNITLEEIKEIISKTMDTKDLVYVVVGDAKTQQTPLNKVAKVRKF